MSNLSDIGFPTPDEQSVNQIIMQALEGAKVSECPAGLYLTFSDPSGAAIFLQGNFEQELIGFNPHFVGASRRSVMLTRKIERDSSPMDGGFFAEHVRGDDAADDFPSHGFVFDVPDFRAVDGDDFPRLAEIQLTAFGSNDFAVFANFGEYQDAQHSDFEVAVRMFAAVGFGPGDADDSSPRPVAKLAGVVISSEKRTNQTTGADFHAILVDTLGGEIDVVIDPRYVTTDIVPGSIVSGTFWLSGRVVG